jgi:deoxyadenosine/deoxycytidine kinase
MLIGIIGESCTGKSTLAEKLKVQLNADVFTGKDYLRLAKNEAIAQKLFTKKLNEAKTGENIIYVISEKEHLAQMPEGAVRILMTADFDLILERFAQRMHGTLPPPVKLMLEKKHGIFDVISYDYHIHNGENADTVCAALEGNV